MLGLIGLSNGFGWCFWHQHRLPNGARDNAAKTAGRKRQKGLPGLANRAQILEFARRSIAGPYFIH
jgi:hypothetical protein